MKILIQLMTYTTDNTVEITLEKAPDGEHQEHTEENKPEEKSFEMMVTQEVENGNDL